MYFSAVANNGVNTLWQTPGLQSKLPFEITQKGKNERTSITVKNNSVVAIFKSHSEAKAAVKEL